MQEQHILRKLLNLVCLLNTVYFLFKHILELTIFLWLLKVNWNAKVLSVKNKFHLTF